MQADEYTTEDSTKYSALTMGTVKKDPQVGYQAIAADLNSRQLVVAYKVRICRTAPDTDDSRNKIEKDLCNDSATVMVNYKTGSVKQVTASANTGTNTGGSAALVEDDITSIEQVRKKLNFNDDQYFIKAWEDRQVTGTAPIEKLMTNDDYEALFSKSIRIQFHDKTDTYYTWENLVKASRYFPKFAAEGTDEDKL